MIDIYLQSCYNKYMTKLEELGPPEYAPDAFLAVGIWWARHVVPTLCDPAEAKSEAGARIASRMNQVAVEEGQRLAPHLASFAIAIADLAREQFTPGMGSSLLVDIRSVPQIIHDAAVESGIVPEVFDEASFFDLFGRTSETRINDSATRVIATRGEAGEFEPVWPPLQPTMAEPANRLLGE
jgi:hypothetical protein